MKQKAHIKYTDITAAALSLQKYSAGGRHLKLAKLLFYMGLNISALLHFLCLIAL